MESILARALEYTLKYWLKSFTRDQFKLQGRTVQLSNLDINGDALHASLGLPPALNVTTAKVGKLEIMLPSVSNVQIEPIVVQIDRLDLVLEENDDMDACKNTSSAQSFPSPGKGSGYGFADKISDGMTVEVRTVNLLLETHGGARQKGGATWTSPMASITIRNLLLYTTNENWQVVNLKEARDFSNNKKFIYLFKKLEWESLSVDLLPHPDMFADVHFASSREGSNKKDDDGAKRVFFGGERFIEGISGQAYITVQRTELNSPLGLEVQLHIPEAVCPTLSEPGLRALLRFFTGFYVCLNRGDLNPNAQQRSTEAAGRSLVSVIVDHIFLCIKDSEFRLELLMQSLFFSRASVSDGDNARCLTQGYLFTPSMHLSATINAGRYRMLSAYSRVWSSPSPAPPSFASQTVVDCQPLMIHLQEESCLKIASLLADGIVVNRGDILPDFSVNSLKFNLKGLDITVPLDTGNSIYSTANSEPNFQSSFAGARLHVEDLFFSESPSLKLKLLNLEKDPACFCLWEDQPIDSSQKKWTAGASLISLSLETRNDSTGLLSYLNTSSGCWRCVELKDARVEGAMATADGSPLLIIPPPGGLIRVGVACQQYLSNTSVEQLFFVLDLYAYFGRVSEKIAIIGKSNRMKKIRNESVGGSLLEKVPSDSAVSLAVKELQLRFLESSSAVLQGMPLVQFLGEDLFIKVTHRTLGGAIVISSNLRWESVEVDCADTDGNLAHENGIPLPTLENGLSMVGNGMSSAENCLLACISGVRLGGGMNYTEALLHRFGILGPDGGPGERLSKGLENLSAGPLSKLFKASPLIADELQDRMNNGTSGDGNDSAFLHLGTPDDVDLSVELKDWLFALEGAQNNEEECLLQNHNDLGREERCWHTTFQSLLVKAKSSPKHAVNGKEKSFRPQKYPVELITVGVEGLQTLKPQSQKHILQNGLHLEGPKEAVEVYGGINLEFGIVISEDNVDGDMVKWVVENFKFSVKQPIEAIVTKDELQHLASLCKSEVDSMGRITAGVLRLLKLEGSIGQAAINQLNNLDLSDFKIEVKALTRFSPRRSLVTGSSIDSSGFSPLSSITGESQQPSTLLSTVASLEELVLDSQAKCSALTAELCSSESSVQHLAEIVQLTQKLESMQRLLTRLRTQI
ncbi:hypothetical protein HYC85_014741 [Camellia sinensis]|uniref:Chorein N-terminal domain-containing protein n=1 Tax=Camellia sinensis TaxID=4442 RepID=A0A7J7HA91_CAMSI|nr:hypothetical protein HYC85_014741 [Camellia sinensis]